MKYKYHCQHQAEEFAHRIIPVPENYPLQKGLPNDFREHFVKLTEFARDFYLDMSKAPEEYGLLLVPIESEDKNLIFQSYKKLCRYANTLERLAICGELKNNQLIINTERFVNILRKWIGYHSSPVVKYELILSKLQDFGFVISDFSGKPFTKKIEFFTVDYPDYPDMIDALKLYCDCWEKLRQDISQIIFQPGEFQHHYCRFDYKITADIAAIPIQQWIIDECDYNCYPQNIKDFVLAFYDYSQQYKGLKFDWSYHFKSKRITAMYTEATRPALYHLGKENIYLSLKLKNLDKYMDYIYTLPDTVQSKFAKSYCMFCNEKETVDKPCKYRQKWTYEGQEQVGCSYWCFYFNDFDIELVPVYWKLLEMEYGLGNKQTGK
ncbi:MAG: hypothetical protein FWG98_13795 [Candidatus Cloacimonetes bacterium]|nr:hypothetical protein [Candidatus Cloacimonadota bacterium]